VGVPLLMARATAVMAVLAPYEVAIPPREAGLWWVAADAVATAVDFLGPEAEATRQVEVGLNC
jgi:hypothetical protein